MHIVTFSPNFDELATCLRLLKVISECQNQFNNDCHPKVGPELTIVAVISLHMDVAQTTPLTTSHRLDVVLILNCRSKALVCAYYIHYHVIMTA